MKIKQWTDKRSQVVLPVQPVSAAAAALCDTELQQTETLQAAEGQRSSGSWRCDGGQSCAKMRSHSAALHALKQAESKTQVCDQTWWCLIICMIHSQLQTHCSGLAEPPGWRQSHLPAIRQAPEDRRSPHPEVRRHTEVRGHITVYLCIIFMHISMLLYQSLLLAVCCQLVQIPGAIVRTETPECQTRQLESSEQREFICRVQSFIHVLQSRSNW